MQCIKGITAAMSLDKTKTLEQSFRTSAKTIPDDGRADYWPITELPEPTQNIEIPEKGDYVFVDQFHTTRHYRDGKLHRDDGPAVYNRHTLRWYKNGEKHREGDLPAVIHADDIYDLGEREWCLNGETYKRHDRLDGRENYWPITETPAQTELQEPLAKGDCVIVDEYGTVSHYRDGELHSDDGPARYNQYSLQWFQHGKKHRDHNLPAVIIAETMDDLGYREWWQHGEKHREEGQAVIRTDNLGQYWLRGQMYDDKKSHQAAVQQERAAEADKVLKGGSETSIAVRKSPLKLKKPSLPTV